VYLLLIILDRQGQIKSYTLRCKFY